MPADWRSMETMVSRKYVCGFCGNTVASDKGFSDKRTEAKSYVCPHCNRPSFFHGGQQVPGVDAGNEVNFLPEAICDLYNEARRCVSVQAYTSSVLSCRKLLMNIAVDQGAEEGKNFYSYVEYLSGKGFVPPNGRAWVDHIRKQGNEATHEIVVKSREDALELISFSEMLLKFVYEFPAKVPQG